MLVLVTKTVLLVQGALLVPILGRQVAEREE
jgi:hypothetical protein